MLLRLGLVFTTSLAVFAAEDHTPVVELVKLVRQSIEKRDKDADLAKVLHKVKLTERLDYGVMDGLETEGVGAKAYAELERLREASRSFPAPATRVVFPQ